MRLIDADLLEEILDVNIQKLQDNIDDARTEVQKVVYEAQLFSTMEMIRVIREQPTAFDVDKVLKQLSEKNRAYYEAGLCNEENGKIKSALSRYDRAEGIEIAYEIVKAGGIDE